MSRNKKKHSSQNEYTNTHARARQRTKKLRLEHPHDSSRLIENTTVTSQLNRDEAQVEFVATDVVSDTVFIEVVPKLLHNSSESSVKENTDELEYPQLKEQYMQKWYRKDENGVMVDVMEERLNDLFDERIVKYINRYGMENRK
jgi:hypothetical protein